MTSGATLRLIWRVWSVLPPAVTDLTKHIGPLHRLRKRFGLRTSTYRPHDDVYNDDYYAKGYQTLGDLHRRSCVVIAESACGELAPQSLLDCGCGNGELLAAFRDQGVATYGLENSSVALQLCRARGLRVEKLDLETSTWSSAIGTHDVVTSVEVAEHLPATCADRFIDLMCAASRRWVILTAATPGQGGIDHVNEQPNAYWIEKLAVRGFAHRRDLSEHWRQDWRLKAICTWYYCNLMVFEREPEPNPG